MYTPPFALLDRILKEDKLSLQVFPSLPFLVPIAQLFRPQTERIYNKIEILEECSMPTVRAAIEYVTMKYESDRRKTFLRFRPTLQRDAIDFWLRELNILHAYVNPQEHVFLEGSSLVRINTIQVFADTIEEEYRFLEENLRKNHARCCDLKIDIE